jgi:hypothetical protein
MQQRNHFRSEVSKRIILIRQIGKGSFGWVVRVD